MFRQLRHIRHGHSFNIRAAAASVVSSALLLVSCCSVSASSSSSLTKDGHAAAAAEKPHLPHYVFGNTTINYSWASGMMFALVGVSVVLEVLMGKIDKAVVDHFHYRAMIQMIYKELTILGILSFSLTIVREVAREHDGAESIEPFILVAFELSHLLIFLVAVVYILIAVVVVSVLRQTRVRWDRVQIQEVEDIIAEKDEHKVNVKIFSLLVSQQYGMGFDFDYARYSYMVMAENIVEMLEIDLRTWFVVLLVNGAFLFLRHISGGNCEWHYVYNLGHACEDSWDVQQTAVTDGHADINNSSANHSRRVLGGTSAHNTDHHGDATTPAPLVYGSLGHSSHEYEATLLRFSAWPVCVIIGCGWLLLGIMVFARIVCVVPGLLALFP